MGWVDNVPRTDGGGLFIGGLHALYQRQDLFRQYKISHIVSMLDFDIYEAGHFKDYKHMHVRIDDDPNENMLEHLEATSDFIENALSNGGAVFVHCAMGKSRSATIVVAYLMRKYGKTPDEALAQLCEGRPVCEPNPGFMEQLDVYHHMLKAQSSSEYHNIYDDWLKNRDGTRDWYTENRRRQHMPKL
ncbi:Dual specificity protein phosphatase 1 [Pseudocercospora fuligena]|uniref:protein-tyrosine-phosphatase n=1 Tax=Pseudocercospora fuligena TaxID=685502 RepID=A0A8H6RB23_9PEZI|nr:Dual specificity protein phosphatase 1 [Pseudocercospora fuligena]